MKLKKARNYGILIFELWWSWRKAELGQTLGISPDGTTRYALLMARSWIATKLHLLGRGSGKD